MPLSQIYQRILRLPSLFLSNIVFKINLCKMLSSYQDITQICYFLNCCSLSFTDLINILINSRRANAGSANSTYKLKTNFRMILD